VDSALESSGVLSLIELAVVTIVLSWWGIQLARREGAPRWMRWVPAAMTALVLAGGALAIWFFADTWKAIREANPAEKQQMLSDGIRNAMISIAAAHVVAGAMLVMLLVVWWRLRRRGPT
jgi:hypothetical protein